MTGAGPTSSATAAPAADAARARQVELILERVQTLPTLSPVAARLLSIGTVDEVLIGDVVKIIESDPALSTRILGLCRKADRGLGDRITTVKRAVLMLGIESVRSAALSVSVYDLMSKDDEAARKALDAQVASETGESHPAGDSPLATFDRKGFWKHSIAVACAAELIAAQHLKLHVLPEEAFLAGLLHDVGKLVLELVLPKSYERVVQLAHRRACESAPVERAVLGLDHHTAGRRVAEHWGLPSAVQSVIWLHGQPRAALPDGNDKNLIGVITVAKALCRRLHLGWSGDFGQPTDPERLWQELGLKVNGASQIAGPLHAAIADRLKVLGLDDTSPPGLLLESLANANKQLSDLNANLQERAAQGAAQTRVLDGIDHFFSLGPSGKSVVETMGLVGLAAWRAFGPGFYGVVVQPGPEQPWQMVQLSPQGTPLPVHVMEAPPERAGGWSLAGLTDPTQLNVAMMGLLPWLSDYLVSAPDLRRLRLMPLVGSSPVRTSDAGPSTVAIVISDREMGEGLTVGALRALTSTWSFAVSAAAERERGRRLGDQLAECGRALAALQAKLSEQESMVRLGETTAGAAHEMNNPLTVVAGHAQLLLTRLENERDRSAAQAIADAATDLTGLISSLHLLSQSPPNKPRDVSLSELVHKVVVTAKARTPRLTQLDLRVDEGAGKKGAACIDPDLTAGALVEVVCNAIEACPNGTVTVSARVEHGRVLIAVVDQGQGMSERALQHAFDPFFSERPAGRGRGLGLTRAKRMIEAMGGEIVLESVAGQGTTVRIGIPVQG